MATPREEKPAQPEARPKGKKRVSPARNAIGLSLLVVCATVAYLEWNANRQHGAAVRKLERYLDQEQDNMLSRDEVEKMIGRAADGPASNENLQQKVTYTWRGVIRKHVLTAYYTGDSKPRLIRIETK
ncbi:MAG: hypothetical protein IRY99_24345 [Isosphaeraceae bacterium]|nr:hypothetical protein [Isosphaeraceae bacterium]